jgi:beta-lactam-binding protein with PASTA domain
MGLKKYFKGKTGLIFWINVVLALGLLFCIPVIAFNTLDSYTNHGEKVSVPSVIGKSFREASQTLDKSGFVAIITDSTYKKSAKPGSVLEQTPKSGTLIKSGRIVYLTVNLKGEPLVKMPDLVGNCSFREAEITLKSLGFKLTAPQYVEGADKDQILRIKQGNRDVHAGESISRERSLTLYVGAGEIEEDSLYFEDGDEDYDIDLDISESNFDDQL